jgi:hypothetical protein
MPIRGRRWQQQMSNHEVKEATNLKPIPRWSKKPLAYEYNYGYAMNFYQPMIDYLDAKESGRKPPIPHLPYANERALDKYRPSNAIHSYTERDLKGFERVASRNAADRLKSAAEFCDATSSKSAYSLSKSYSAASVTKQVVTQVRKSTSSSDQKVSFKSHGLQHSSSMGSMKGYESDVIKESRRMLNASNSSLHQISSQSDIDNNIRISRQSIERATKPINEIKSELRNLDRKAVTYLEDKR